LHYLKKKKKRTNLRLKFNRGLRLFNLRLGFNLLSNNRAQRISWNFIIQKAPW